MPLPYPLNVSRISHAWLRLFLVVTIVFIGALILHRTLHVRGLEKKINAYAEAVDASAFQLERAYLRFTHALTLEARSSTQPDVAALTQSADLLSRLGSVVASGQHTKPLRNTPQYILFKPQLDQLLQDAYAVFARTPTNLTAYTELARRFEALQPDVHGLTALAVQINVDQETAYLLQRKSDNETVLLAMWALMALVLVFAVIAHQSMKATEIERLSLVALSQNLTQANARAEAASIGKDRFLANMSHELRTPLNGMLGMLGLMEGTPLSTTQADFVQTARDSARHLLLLLNDVLDLSSLESDKFALHTEPMNLPDLFHSMNNLLRPLASGKHLSFEIITAPDLPVWIKADSTRIQQIVLNLCSNAIKFSDTGQVTLEVLLPSGPPPAPGQAFQLLIRVSDQGWGMSQTSLSTLFTRFEQGDNKRSRRTGGTGLGLEISRNLARAMGGDITAVSTLGEGSVFTTFLLLTCLENQPAVAVDRTLAFRDANTPGLDIVVAEDHPTNRKLMAVLLNTMGHTVRFAEDGEQAIAEVMRKLPDIVLMDMHMPLMDGLEATRTLRAHPGATQTVPIAALTADVFDETRQLALAAGMSGFLTKPVNVDKLEQLLIQLTGGRGVSCAPPALVPVSPSALRPLTVAVPVPSLQPPSTPTSTFTSSPTLIKAVTIPPKRRRFRVEEVAQHINMEMVGQMCLGITLRGYCDMLATVLRGESGSLDQLLKALDAANTEALAECGHAFKGEALSLGLQALALHATVCEKEGAAFSADTCHTMAATLRNTWETTQALCQRMGYATAG